MLGITTTNARVGGFRGGISAEAKTIYNRIIADGGVSNLTRLNFFVKGLKAIYGDLANVPVCYDAHWIGYKLGSGTGATAGQAAAKLYSLTVAGDAVQSTAASQPLLLAHNGDNYWWGSGVSGNYCSTPNAAANQIVGTIEYKVYLNNLDWTKEVLLLSKFNYLTSSNKGCGLLNTRSAGNNYFVFIYSADGINSSYVFSDAHSLANNINYVVKYSGVAGGVGSFWYSTDNGVTYTQIGANKSHPSTWFNSTLPITIGTSNDLSANFQGKIYRATISNSIGGAPVVDFNPATYNASTSQTQWTSATGEVWTINTGTATTGYKSALVSRTLVQSDGVDDTMQATSYALTATGVSVYSTYRKFTTAVNPSGFSVLVETSANVNSNQGFLVDFNEGVNTSVNAIRGDVGTTNASFSDTSVLLKLVTSVFDLSLATEEPSFYAVNNSALTKVSGTNVNNTTMTTSVLNLMARNGVTGLANMTFNGLIISSAADNLTTRTATYNLIRSLNNNAF
jgi:hypothetical protein